MKSLFRYETGFFYVWIILLHMSGFLLNLVITSEGP
jgi:hypothetical protein